MTIAQTLYAHQYAKDAASTQLDIVSRRVSNSDTEEGIDVEGIYTVPGDRVLSLNNAIVTGYPGTGQAVVELAIVYTIGNVTYYIVSGGGSDLADGRVSYSFQGEMFLPSGAVITGSGNFDAGVAGNGVLVSISGVSIPRGNFSLGG